MMSLAEPGWTLTPWILKQAAAALKVSQLTSSSAPPSTVYAKSAPKRSRSSRDAPCPISSSGAKHTATPPWGSPRFIRRSQTVRISAIPALSSAPSRVVPSVVMRVWPRQAMRSGNCAGLSTSPLWPSRILPPS